MSSLYGKHYTETMKATSASFQGIFIESQNTYEDILTNTNNTITGPKISWSQEHRAPLKSPVAPSNCYWMHNNGDQCLTGICKPLVKTKDFWVESQLPNSQE